MSSLIFCGELIADMSEGQQGSGQFGLLPGGCSYFGAVAAASNANLAHTDDKVYYLGPISRDDFGGRLRALLEDKGVSLEFAVETDRPTTLAVISRLANGENGFQFYSDGTTVGAILPDEMAIRPDGDEQRIFVYGSISTILEGSREILLAHASQAKEDGVIYLDLNARPVAIERMDDYPGLVDRWAAIADVVKASDVDLENAYPGQNRKEVAQRWLDHGAKLAIVTSGGNGSWALDASGGEVEVAARPLHTPNTVGAGDSFNAGVCEHLVKAVTREELRALNWPRALAEMALTAGNRSASLHLTTLGARPVDSLQTEVGPEVPRGSERDESVRRGQDPQP